LSSKRTCRYASLFSLSLLVLLVPLLVLLFLTLSLLVLLLVQPYGTYETVRCGDAANFETLTTFFKVLLVIAGVYLTYATRNVDDKYAESKWIGISIYQVAIFGAVGLLVQGAAPESLLLVQAICVPLCTALTCCLIFAPKFLMIRNGTNGRGENGSTITRSGTTGSTNSTEDIKQYEMLKAENKELKETIKKLEKAAVEAAEEGKSSLLTAAAINKVHPLG
jgi:hypothetical protein